MDRNAGNDVVRFVRFPHRAVNSIIKAILNKSNSTVLITVPNISKVTAIGYILVFTKGQAKD